MTILTRVIFIFALLYAPILGYWYLTGLSGSNPFPHVIMLVGHVAVLIGSYLAVKNRKFYIAVAVGSALFFFGQRADKKFWQSHNSNLCQQIKSDPHCMETAVGYQCQEPSSLGNFNVAKTICISEAD